MRVNDDGLAPAYRSGPRFPRIRLEPETVPAWRTSEIGLTSESAPTRQGAGDFRAIPDASYPFDFTLPVAGDAPLEFWFEVRSGDAPAETSPVGRLLLK